VFLFSSASGTIIHHLVSGEDPEHINGPRCEHEKINLFEVNTGSWVKVVLVSYNDQVGQK
jgi:hypothetical protein